MATLKTFTAIWDNRPLVANAADSTSTSVNLNDGYGASLHIKLTNGTTGPTAAAQVSIEVSGDDSEWYEFGGPLVGLTSNSGVISWGSIEIPWGVEHLRLVAGSNTDENVTVDADISEITSV